MQTAFSIPYTVNNCHIALSLGGVMCYVKVYGPIANTCHFDVPFLTTGSCLILFKYGCLIKKSDHMKPACF